MEMASIMNGLGSQVEMIIRGENILKGFDRQCALFLQDKMIQKGITLHSQTTVEKIVKQKEGGLSVFLSNQREVRTQEILFALGRIPNTQGLELQNAGVCVGRGGEILVNEQNQTNQKNIFAVGGCHRSLEFDPGGP